MYYIKLTDKEIDFIGTSISVMYLELDDVGNSVREVGFDEQNDLIHKFPSKYYENGDYGLFDLSPFEIEDLESDLSVDEFEEIWGKS
jgi:hypothetical protein